jgi:hypothetical protein
LDCVVEFGGLASVAGSCVAHDWLWLWLWLWLSLWLLIVVIDCEMSGVIGWGPPEFGWLMRGWAFFIS